MAAGFNKSSRSRKISGGGTSAGQQKPVTTGSAGAKKVGINPKMAHENKKGGMKGGKYC